MLAAAGACRGVFADHVGELKSAIAAQDTETSLLMVANGLRLLRKLSPNFHAGYSQ